MAGSGFQSARASKINSSWGVRALKVHLHTVPEKRPGVFYKQRTNQLLAILTTLRLRPRWSPFQLTCSQIAWVHAPDCVVGVQTVSRSLSLLPLCLHE
jgi:hypothetical protein